MREADIQREIVKLLERAGYLVFRMNAGRAKKNVTGAPAGTPDLLSISPKGRHLWIEVKTKEGKISEEQAAMQESLMLRGDSVITARSVEEVVNIVYARAWS